MLCYVKFLERKIEISSFFLYLFKLKELEHLDNYFRINFLQKRNIQNA